MNRVIVPAFAIAAILLTGCGNGSIDASDADAAVATSAPQVSFKPDEDAARTAKPQGPVTIAYRIIGTPVVGQPVGVDLEVQSNLGPQPITLSYRVNDTTAMEFAEAQEASVSIAATSDTGPTLQQVQVVPLREGRVFLNVSATIETENGTTSTVTAIPIEVGEAPRQPQENGEVLTDEDGELVRSVPATEN
jgi:hypothetical protein